MTLLAALSLALAGCGDDPEEDGAVDCTDDALEVDGTTYGRDPERNCQFVGPDGEVLQPQP